MPIFTKRDRSVLFIHIPKTAGTTIEDTFGHNGFEMSYRRGGRYGKRTAFDEANGCSPQHMHAALLDTHLSDRAFEAVFTIVRHPLARFESEYRFRAAAGHPLARDGIDAFARAALWRFSKRNPMVLDNHIRPQIDFLWHDCAVFRLEDGMDRILSQVADLLSAPLAPVPGLAAMRSDTAIPSQMSPETEEAVRSFYQPDFERLGYE